MFFFLFRSSRSLTENVFTDQPLLYCVYYIISVAKTCQSNGLTDNILISDWIWLTMFPVILKMILEGESDHIDVKKHISGVDCSVHSVSDESDSSEKTTSTKHVGWLHKVT